MPDQSYQWSIWYEEMQRQNPEGTEERTMTDDERLRFLRVFNSTPPITDVNPDRIEMFWSNPSQILVAFVENGCVTHTGLLMRQLLESIISPNTNGYERPFNPMDREA